MKAVLPPVMVKRYYQVARQHIAVVQFIIEGYEGMATVTTIDAKQACLQISIIENQLDDFDYLAEDLKQHFGMKEMPRPDKSATQVCADANIQ